MSLVLLVEGAMIAVFTALDVFLFFMCWEITMIPMYFMIILWGGPGGMAAGIKFVLYSLTGSLLLLVGILGLYVQGGRTFDLAAAVGAELSVASQMWIFAAFLLAFAIKLPMIPFHSWLPDAHSEAPTAGSVILAGVLLKMGGYGFLRFGLPILPDASAAFAPVISWFSVAAILYGGYLALAQTDLKRLIAYSSISHMGFVTLGIFSFNGQGIQGAVLQMFNHGITTGALFLAVGQLYDRTHSRVDRRLRRAARRRCRGSPRSCASSRWRRSACRARPTSSASSWCWSAPRTRASRRCCSRWAASSWRRRTCCGCCSA